MGNEFNLCNSHPADAKSQINIEQSILIGNFEKLEDSIKSPPLSQELSDLIVVKKPFYDQLHSIKNARKIQNHNYLYIGEISTMRYPHGWGKMYCKNGDVIIGQFQKGTPKGKCFCGHSNGTYHQGQIINGKITCQNGVYYSQSFQYVGGFKQNVCHGKGKIIKENYVLIGEFNQGVIVNKGRLEWKEAKNQCYTYTGQFNEKIEMHGRGILEQPYGRYEGTFVRNKKQGKGQYKFKNGYKFTGHYEQGLKEGYGQLYNKFDQVVYKGEWKRDYPSEQNQTFIRQMSRCKSGSNLSLQRSQSLRSMATQSF